jgi:hypothetical protein
VLFNQAVIAGYSCNAVRYVPEMRAEHLEITSAWSWYRKLIIYGRSFETYKNFASVRPLSRRERMEVWRALAHKEHFGPFRTVAAMAALAAGAACYSGGRWMARFKPAKPG